MERLAIHGGEPASPHMLGYGRQNISAEDVRAVVDSLASDYLTCGPATERFERDLEAVTSAKHVTAVSNGTAALHVACMAAGIASGDEVIVSPITFAASANCVLYCGARPVFTDIDSRTWNIDPSLIRSKITKSTKAIVAVDFGGVAVEADSIRAICDEYGLTFIEDAAHSIGTRYKGRNVGTLADITTFSFHPVKTVTTAEGGAVATSNDALAREVVLYAKHGITRDSSLLEKPDEGGWYYEQLRLGYNYRITDIQAALGSSQLKRLDAFARRRRQIVARYNEAFEGIPEVSFQHDLRPQETVRHLYCLRFDVKALGTTRRFVFDALRAENIGVNVHYLPVYRLPYYRELGYDPTCCPKANAYYDEAVTLPLHVNLDNGDVENVIRAVKKIVENCKASA